MAASNSGALVLARAFNAAARTLPSAPRSFTNHWGRIVQERIEVPGQRGGGGLGIARLEWTIQAKHLVAR
jgi:hypothetical protein